MFVLGQSHWENLKRSRVIQSRRHHMDATRKNSSLIPYVGSVAIPNQWKSASINPNTRNTLDLGQGQERRNTSKGFVDSRNLVKGSPWMMVMKDAEQIRTSSLASTEHCPCLLPTSHEANQSSHANPLSPFRISLSIPTRQTATSSPSSPRTDVSLRPKRLSRVSKTL